MLQQIKSLMLPIAMLLGFIFSKFFAEFDPLTPYLIFIMLFVTFCRISPKEMKLSAWHFWLLLFQLSASIGLYLLVRGINETVAQGLLICILAPTATSSVVIAGMLGANIATMATFSLICNLTVAIAAPIIFSFVGTMSELPFIESFLLILGKVVPLLVVPFIAAFALQKLSPKAIEFFKRIQIVSFYLWALALMIVTGRTVEFIIAQDSTDYSLEIYMAAITFVVCVGQFLLGRAIGKRYDDTVAAGQSLGQKNTILAIWMTQTYLLPIVSIAPASYVLWQNIVNSWQLWRKRKESREL